MIEVTESIRGLKAAKRVQAAIKAHGVLDVELFYDHELKMWSVCQTTKKSDVFILETARKHVQPIIMWWVKNTADGTYRDPSERDVSDVIAVVQRAQKTWEKGGEWLADQLDAQDKAKDDAHKAKRAQLIKDVAPSLKKYIKKELS